MHTDRPVAAAVERAPEARPPTGLWIVHQGPLGKPSRARRSLSVGLSTAWCERLFVLLSNGELASCKCAAGCAVFPSVDLLSDNKALSLPSKPYAYIGRTGHAVAARTDSKQAQFAVTTAKRTFTLRAPSTSERDAWIAAINGRAAALGDGARVAAARDASAAAERDAPPEWSDATPRAAAGGGAEGLVYTLRPSAVGALARESMEWNMASQQFERLLGAAERGRHAVVAVDVIDVHELRRRYHDARAVFSAAGKNTEEIWVFHGTTAAALRGIVAHGFAVGGRTPGVHLLNGAVHGHGVYAATGPETPSQYGQHARPFSWPARMGGAYKAVILARATPGRRGADGSRGEDGADAWYPRGDWAVFRRGEQLLPTYVVYFQ